MNDREHQKLCSARSIYHRAEQATPIAGISWAKWFEQMYGEEYYAYVERMKAKRDEN